MTDPSLFRRMKSCAVVLCASASTALSAFCIMASIAFVSVMPFAMAGLAFDPLTMLPLLQDRFRGQTADCAQPPVAILVPGGGLQTFVVAVRERRVPPGPGERITVALELARTYPAAKLVLSGAGEEDPTALFARLGIEPGRVIRETRSRNTFENAALAARILHPRPDQCFVLVTSALHMPRAVGSYRAAGFAVSTRSVDFRQISEPKVERGVWNEFIGLVLYRLTWRTHEVFPR